jgi:HSP20 family protein
MTTRRWDPLRDLLNLQEKMNRLFEDSLAATRADPGAPVSAWTPAADVYETPDGFVVLMDLPGLSADDVEIHVDGERLVVRGERHPADTTRPESFHRVERSYGVFRRVFQLTDEVDPDKVTANFRDGLLRLELTRLRSRGAGRSRPERPEA